MKIKPGTVIERYVVDKAIGAGGTAMVYRIIHSQLHTSFALKVLTITSDSIRKRILLEGQVQAALRHVNIVAVTDVLDVQGSPGLVMEYIEGPSLERALRKYHLAMRDAETLFCGVVAGVKHAHSHGLVHRDLKPANVLLANSSSGYIPKVTDFGLAKVIQGEGVTTGQTRSGIAMGTPSYMAPEQIQDARNVDQRADLFSLGCILYELVTRRRAFPGDQALPIYNSICMGKYISAKAIIPQLPQRLEMAISGCLAVDRDDRIPDCDALIRVFKGQQEWVVGESGYVPDDGKIPERKVGDNAPIMTIADGGSKHSFPRPSAAAVDLLRGEESIENSEQHSDVGMFMQSANDSISDAVDPVTLLPDEETSQSRMTGPVFGLLLFLLVGSWSLMAIYWWADNAPEVETVDVEQPIEVPVPVIPEAPIPVSAPLEPAEALEELTSPDEEIPVVKAAPTPSVKASAIYTVKVLSIPPTARVRVNDEERGRTPAKLDLAAGEYEVHLKSGEAAATFKIDVMEGSPNKWCYNFANAHRYEGSCPR